MTKQTAEEILREYVDFKDVNGSKTVKLLPLTITDAMEEYAEYQLKELLEAVEELRNTAKETDTDYQLAIDDVERLIKSHIND